MVFSVAAVELTSTDAIRATLSPDAAAAERLVRFAKLTVSPPAETVISLVLIGRTLPIVDALELAVITRV